MISKRFIIILETLVKNRKNQGFETFDTVYQFDLHCSFLRFFSEKIGVRYFLMVLEDFKMFLENEILWTVQTDIEIDLYEGK